MLHIAYRLFINAFIINALFLANANYQFNSVYNLLSY